MEKFERTEKQITRSTKAFRIREGAAVRRSAGAITTTAKTRSVKVPKSIRGEKSRQEGERSRGGVGGQDSRTDNTVGGEEGTQKEAVECRPPLKKDRQPAAVFGGGQ